MQEEVLSIVEEYQRARSNYEGYTEKMYRLICSLINEYNIDIHSIDKRTKGIKSLEEKIRRKGNSYNKLLDITDLSGIRIICYFSSQVENIAEIIEQNFEIIPELSIDKKKLLDPDRFGYLSLHYVVRLSESRRNLPEYKKYGSFLCEIQIRSILQHSWAEIEHDLGYKSSIEIPREIKRRFYRLSGLLELADDEFNNLKAEIEDYSKSLKNESIELNKEIYIDVISLHNYIFTSPTVKEIDKLIADLMCCELIDEVPSAYEIKLLSYFEITRISELDKIVKENKNEIIFLSKEWSKSDDEDYIEIGRGITLFYLGYVLIGKTMEISQVVDYLKKMSIYVEEDETCESVAEEIIWILKKYYNI